MRYQWLHRSGQLETAPLPIRELKTEGSEAELGADPFEDLSAGARASWVMLSGDLK